MGGRMTTLKESQKSVSAYQSEQAAKRDGKRRVSSQFRVNDFVMVERRPAQVRGVLGGEQYVVKFSDDESRVQVSGAGMVRRFTSQTTGFAPKGAERVEVEEEVSL